MNSKKQVAVLLSGCGVYDGAEIHESVLTLLALDQNGIMVQCFAPDRIQHHVIDHTNGLEMGEQRNALVEAARIARGDIKSTSEFNVDQYDALVMPGGFGVAKNFTKWAFSGPDGEILPEIKKMIVDFHQQHKPILGLCMAGTSIAKALEDKNVHPEITVGTFEAASPYDIKSINQGIEKTGAIPILKKVEEIHVDEKHKIITTPCYMMEAGITQIYKSIEGAVQELIKRIN